MGTTLSRAVRPTRGARLNPLQQRLLLYRFAVLEVLGGDVLEPLGLGLPHLQQVKATAGWRRILTRCPPLNPLGSAPVVSPSLTALRRIRKTQPTRPLIWCRPAYLPSATTGARALIRPHHQLCVLLAKEDPLLPLRRHPPSPTSSQETTLLHATEIHPGQRLLQRRQRDNPGSLLYLREDGRVQEQWSLFQPIKQLAHHDLERAVSRHYQHFQQSIGGLCGCHYVCAGEASRLAWFARDCLRVLPPRFRCVTPPFTPKSGDPFTYFILSHDPTLRLTRLNPAFPLLHLDGDADTRRYRAARQARGRPRWQCEEHAEVSAQIMFPEGVMRFVLKDGVWQSYRGGEQATKDASYDLHCRLQAHRFVHTAPN